METPFGIYAGTPGSGFGKWEFIPDTKESREKAIGEGKTAFSPISFEYAYEEGKPEPLRKGDLWIDIDCKDDPASAVCEGRFFINKLCQDFDDFNPNMVRFYMSGSKGVHICIPAIMFGGEAGHPCLPKIHARMLELRKKAPGAVGIYKDPVDMFDMSLYKMKRGHLLREANIKRPDSLYKVPVSTDEFLNEDIDMLLGLTSKKRYLEVMPMAPVRTKMAELYAKAEEEINKECSSSSMIRAGLLQCDFIKYCKDNQAALSEPKWFKMISLLAKIEGGRKLAHKFSKEHPKYSVEETDKKFNDALHNKYYISCKGIQEEFKCSRNCGVNSPLELHFKEKIQQGLSAEFFSQRQDGVYFSEIPGDEDRSMKICSPMKVLGKIRNAHGTGWARLVEIQTPDGNLNQVYIPMRDCAGRGDTVRGLLLDTGLEIPAGSKVNTLLMEYLRVGSPENEYLLQIEQIGWHDDDAGGVIYVLPDMCIGGDFNKKIYFSAKYDSIHKMSGTLDEWHEQIGRYCRGNSLLILAVSFALTGPLLRPCFQEGGGLHIYGGSSSGKTTLALVAGSVCGGGGRTGYIKQWRTTHNALESTAAMHNDNLLVLDEIAQAASDAIFQIAYMLPNGQGKERLRSDASKRDAYVWRLNFLSTGEITLAEKIEENGRNKSMAGQEVRIINLPIDAGTGSNVFTCLHMHESPASISDYLKEVSQKVYGSPLRNFLQSLCGSNAEQRQECIEQIESVVEGFVQVNCPQDASGQVKRVCRKFGLIAAVGELAIEFGTLPFERGDAYESATEWFHIWLEQRNGSGDLEIENAMRRIQDHFARYSENRYLDLDLCSSGSSLSNLAGYRWESDGKRHFLMISAVFSELAGSVNKKTLKMAMDAKGWLVRTNNDTVMETKYVRGESKRGIVFKPYAWEGEAQEEKKVEVKEDCNEKTTPITLSVDEVF